MKDFLRAIKYIKPYWHLLLAAIICSTFSSCAHLVFPWVNKILIDDVFTLKNASLLLPMLLMLVASATAIFLFELIKNCLFTYVGERVIIDLRTHLFQHLRSLSFSYYQKARTGDMISLFINDIPTLGELYRVAIGEALASILYLAVLLAVIITIDWQIALLALLILPIYAIIPNMLMKHIKRSSQDVQNANAQITTQLQDSITASKEVTAFSCEEWDIKRVRKEFIQILNKKLQLTLLETGTTLSYVAFWTFVCIVYWFGGQDVLEGDMSIGTLIALGSYFGYLAQPVQGLIRHGTKIQIAMGAEKRIFSFLNVEQDIFDSADAIELGIIQGEVTFNNVRFTYPDGKEVLTYINLNASPGEMIAIVGHSGSGKSTLLNLIPRFFDVTDGSITIDGHDIRTIKVKSLREHIGYVFQETFLYAASIMDNIRFGNINVDDNEVIAAAIVANADNFIQRLPLGYDTKVGERGVKLSGGEKQRIAIARAILRNPRIMILDEATSALDSESEQLVQEALEKLMLNRTSFVVAHRLSTVHRADKIIVLDHGRIAESGTHGELIKKQGLYHKLYKAQFKDIETINSDL